MSDNSDPQVRNGLTQRVSDLAGATRCGITSVPLQSRLQTRLYLSNGFNVALTGCGGDKPDCPAQCFKYCVTISNSSGVKLSAFIVVSFKCQCPKKDFTTDNFIGAVVLIEQFIQGAA